jgi:peptidoglycan/LPS O-acetylase OafA/YrhL
MSVVSPLAGTYILFSVAFLPALKLQRFGKYGDFSYGLYVYAFPIQQALVAVMGNDVGVLKLFIPSFLLTLLAGIISWYAIEAPFMKLKKLGQPKPPAQPHAA